MKEILGFHLIGCPYCENAFRAIDELVAEKTAVYISHRLSSAKFCNRIAVFHNGEIIELGTHDALMRQGGAYARLFAMQAQYYA